MQAFLRATIKVSDSKRRLKANPHHMLFSVEESFPPLTQWGSPPARSNVEPSTHLLQTGIRQPTKTSPREKRIRLTCQTVQFVSRTNVDRFTSLNRAEWPQRIGRSRHSVVEPRRGVFSPGHRQISACPDYAPSSNRDVLLTLRLFSCRAWQTSRPPLWSERS